MSEFKEVKKLEGINNRIQWMKHKYPDFKVEDRFLPYLQCAEENTPLSGGETDEDTWVPVASVQDLKDLLPITHELWIVPDAPNHWDEVERDVKGGVTFAFYWQEGALCWER
ncbi:MAG: hypothetical protein J7619_15940 [Dyadobacter sp.]|uniref:hypothetical protein n=1 Tax=Dyadobacter sp. TaxID=1914288 RepID=UPI001B0466FA|nr:hypothetical protein [Dyadobacter sp.]MBO9614197.1 hypothetical protein [Dyadobacter sp.]